MCGQVLHESGCLLALCPHRLQELNEEFARLSVEEARSVVEGEVKVMLFSCPCSCTLVALPPQVAALRRQEEAQLEAARAKGVHRHKLLVLCKAAIAFCGNCLLKNRRFDACTHTPSLPASTCTPPHPFYCRWRLEQRRGAAASEGRHPVPSGHGQKVRGVALHVR